MLGLLMLQTRFPRPPGDIGHPGAFSFPVRRVVVDGASPAAVVRGGDAALLAPFIDAARRLVDDGALAIGTSCGFLARWQRELQAALPVPVWTSSLLLLAEARCRGFGVITIESVSLTPAHFEAVGADPDTPVEGITAGSPLHRTLLEDLAELDEDDARAQVVAAGRRLLAREPALRGFVLECTNLPPYAAALEATCGLPVRHAVSMLEERMAGLGRCAAGGARAGGGSAT